MTPKPKVHDATLEAISDSGFQNTLQRGSLVVVAFVREWSGSCHLLTHALSELAKEYEGRALVATMDVEKNRETPRLLGVTETPSLLFFRDAQLRDRIAGSAPRITIVRTLEKLLAQNSTPDRAPNCEGLGS